MKFDSGPAFTSLAWKLDWLGNCNNSRSAWPRRRDLTSAGQHLRRRSPCAGADDSISVGPRNTSAECAAVPAAALDASRTATHEHLYDPTLEGPC